MPLIRQIVNANAYLDGGSLLGQIEEFTLPEPETTTVEHKWLGGFGSVKLPSGLQVMEASIKFKSFFRDTFQRFYNPFASMEIQVRANVEDFEAGDRVNQSPYVAFMTVNSRKFAAGMFKPQENAEFNAEMDVTYLRIEEAGRTVLELDVMANIWKVGNQDVLAQWRRNLGV